MAKRRKIIPRSTPTSELGFGRYMTIEGRLMNPDGSFNVRRDSLSPLDNLYYALISMPLGWFLGCTVATYLAINVLFASAYLFIGIEYLNGVALGTFWENFGSAFFFSTQTLTTVGYGHISPKGVWVNVIASFESFTGLLLFALISGLLYGRFSRPVSKIVFSDQLLVAPFQGKKALMFRMGNAHKGEILEAEAQVMLACNVTDDHGETVRKYYPLSLQVPKIPFFSLSWTIVHPLDADSPVADFSMQDYVDSNAEVLVLVKAIEETNQQMIHARHSYTAQEMVWNARFLPIMARTKEGYPRLLTGRMSDYEMVEG